MRDKSGVKCPACNSCTRWIYVTNHRFVYCHFCDKYYRLLPGHELEESTLEDIERIWKQEIWE